MTSLREMKEREYIPNKTYIKLTVLGTLSLSKVLLTNLHLLRRARKIPVTKKYVRPPRRYELPEYRPGMECHAREDTKYLRRTLYVEPCAKEIVAMAHELGAGEKDDYTFANDAFEFVKRNLTLEYLEMDDAVATLKRGTGTCLHMLNLYVALCRAAGIKARYKLYALQMAQEWFDSNYRVDPMFEKWYRAMGYFMIHGEAEVLVDGKWYVADVAPTPERQAAAGIPITKFGEDSIGIWFFAVPGTIMNVESLPYGLGISMKLLKIISPGTVNKLNANVVEQIEKGKKILERMGEEEYDRMARRKKRKPTMELEHKEGLIFKYE